MHLEKARILFNHRLGAAYYRMGLKCSEGFLDAVPGQFVMLKADSGSSPLLRRPFSIHQLIEKPPGPGLMILYKVVGESTAKMAACKKGETVDIFGPLGSGFRFDRHWRRLFLVAGGVGVAPLVLLASSLAKNDLDLSASTVFLGGRSGEDLLCEAEFRALGLNVHLTTDDGSIGDPCLVTHPLEAALARRRPDAVFACGPMEMLRCVAGLAEKHRIACQVSMETMMACGMGACLGCAVDSRDTTSRYLHACLDGPVFDTSALKL